MIKKLSLLILLMLLFVFCSKRQDKTNSSANTNSDLDISKPVDSTQLTDMDSNNINSKKFVYVLIKIKTPKLHIYEHEGTSEFDENMKLHENIPSKSFYSTNWDESF